MFKNNYQGGAAVEIFSGQGKDPAAKWKLSGGPSVIHKEYDKEVKGFVYCLEGSSQTVKMQMPMNGKMSLGLLQRFLVLQVYIPQIKDFSTELVITDSQHLKRRLHLSTVHKELSSTLLHAKIPLVGLKRNIWSTLCIDLVSFSDELFKGFLTLDGITLYATCKVRRILTIKPEPSGMSEDDMFLSGAGLMDLIPRSCHFPPGVSHVIQVLDMQSLQKADVRAGLLSSDCVPDKSAMTKTPRTQRTRPQVVSHAAAASRVPGSSSRSGRESSVTSDRVERSLLCISKSRSSLSRTNKKVAAESQSSADLVLNAGTPGSLQPHPPKDKVFDKVGSKKLRVCSAGKEKPALSAPLQNATPSSFRQRSKAKEICSLQVSRQPLTPTEKYDDLTADECSYSPDKESSEAATTPAESVSCSVCPALSADLQVCSSWESNEGSEPELILQEVFTFLSQPHSPKRGQGPGDQEKVEMEDEQVESGSRRRYEAQPEHDFIGSESDEDTTYTTYHHQRSSAESNPSTPRSPNATLEVQLEVHPESQNMDRTTQRELRPTAASTQPALRGRAEPAGIVPTRCLSPSTTPSRQEQKCHPQGSEVVSQVLVDNSSVSLSRRLLQEVKVEDSTRPKPANQGHHYQKEMSPLLQSNPREWMDVLSPPIMPPSQQRRSDGTWNNPGNLIAGEEESLNEEENEEEYLNLLYDPCLNCYFDPKTGKYYELA
ncbi:uncharacterized protein C3orf67 homolog isoform X2 [Notolabrus celidotus]|uniref:uncharacterized protein C3orf67 homolog isoform X2 n=1 Tax=Notolabrus celidotus TaxID=1203425 RepID=UPI00148F45C7|nr:uncharacterized protein C3orf67 homolog isoform X2 [Notolabrus celidotus]